MKVTMGWLFWWVALSVQGCRRVRDRFQWKGKPLPACAAATFQVGQSVINNSTYILCFASRLRRPDGWILCWSEGYMASM
jgi:hypothetical protein